MFAIRSHHKATAGFSLIESLVGMLIGLFSMIVVMQTFSIFEAQKRTTTGGGDAQTNGAIALNSLQRDIKQSGYGLSAYSMLGCNLLLPTGTVLNLIAPVTINHPAIPAGDANTDTMLIAYGNGNGSGDGDGILTASAGSPYIVKTPTSFNIGDRIILGSASPPSPCALTLTMDTVTAINGSNVSVAQPGASSAVPTANAPIYNAGQSPKVLVYAVRQGNLTVCDYMVNNCGNAGDAYTPLVNNIVSLRAQYGRDTAAAGAMDGIVDTYDQSAPASACDLTRIPAVRFALVARNGQPAELRNGARETVTTADPQWAGSAAAPINLSGTTVPAGINWQNYRYKTFQTVVPLRNIAWQGVQTGC